jgi:transcription initiation factor IIE alpha subunit
MKLISCESCGVALDMDRIIPTVENDGYYPTETVFNCPNCKARLDYNTGEEI